MAQTPASLVWDGSNLNALDANGTLLFTVSGTNRELVTKDLNGNLGAIKATSISTGTSASETAVTATAAELNTAADISAQAAIAANGDTLEVTAAAHAGRVICFGKTTGTTVTLPAATGTGHRYTFIVSVAATSNANIIKVANATDVMAGSLNIQADVDSDGTSKTWFAGATADGVVLAGAATTGGYVGNRIECVDYKTGFWHVTAYTESGGGSEATCFSTFVS